MQLFPASRVSLRHSTSEEKEDEEEEHEDTDKRETEWDPLKEIYSTEQRMRSFRESGHRHSARNSRVRSRIRTYEGLELPRSVFWCAMTTSNRLRSFLSFFSRLFFSFWYHLFSTFFLSSPSRPPSLSFSCSAWVNCSWDSSGSHSGVNSFTPLLIPFLYFGIYRVLHAISQRSSIRFTIHYE